MSLFKITEDNTTTFTLETHPHREYFSGSTGVTGSVFVFARHSSIEKETQPISFFSSSFYTDENINDILEMAKVNAVNSNSNKTNIEGYLTTSYQQQPSARKQQKLEIYRFTPPFDYNKNTGRKITTLNTLMPYYRVDNPNYNFNVSNYFCLNFFTSAYNPRDAVLLYPNVSNSYNLGAQWSFDFWINPAYKTTGSISPSPVVSAGTIMHLSGMFAISVISGSSKDINLNDDGEGICNSYRILLQLSQSANIPPSQIGTTSSLVIMSSDNSLPWNTWNHVTIRFGGTGYNGSTGSIYINNVLDTNFVITTSLVTPAFAGGVGPKVLCVGNYYEGTNNGTSEQTNFFGQNTSLREGLYELTTDAVDLPASYSFNHPLNAQVHDLKMYNKYLNNNEMEQLFYYGPQSLNNLQFYVPPFFTYTSPTRSYYLGKGGIPVSPFQTINGSTHDLFATTMSFAVGGQFINLENYTKDFATNRFPRLMSLTSSLITTTTDQITANEFLFRTGSNVYRQYLLMPCDNGLFIPNTDFLYTEPSYEKFTNDLGHTNIGKITLRNLINEDDKSNSISYLSNSFANDFIGISPTNVSGSWKDSLAIYHRTRDNSSNQCVFFDVSNLFYGNRITPGTLTIRDSNVSYTDNKFGITIKDDGLGGIYLANSLTEHAAWNNIGNIFYNEGIIIIKSPQLFFFGENEYEISFKGETNIHVLKFNLLLPGLTATSSSNPNYQVFSSSLANTQNDNYVWLSNLYVHDDNMNVIMKTVFAQPIQKKTSDKLLFAPKIDF